MTNNVQCSCVRYLELLVGGVHWHQSHWSVHGQELKENRLALCTKALDILTAFVPFTTFIPINSLLSLFECLKFEVQKETSLHWMFFMSCGLFVDQENRKMCDMKRP